MKKLALLAVILFTGCTHGLEEYCHDGVKYLVYYDAGSVRTITVKYNREGKVVTCQ